MANKYRKNNQTVLEVIIIGLFKALWFLISLPFKKIKFGRQKSGLSVEEKNYIVAKRLELEKMIRSENHLELRHVLMEADKLVDHTLKLKGFSGETFADRLRSAESSIPKELYNDIWQGHKVRNQIAHEQEFSPPAGGRELSNASEKLLNYIKFI